MPDAARTDDDAVLVMDDDDFLALVSSERRQSVGFDHDDELLANRTRAMNYLKGVVEDLPTLEGRSTAVTTDLADAIETLMPDLMEILASGDDVATFQPVDEDDEEAARLETDHVNHIVFNENEGWKAIYSHIQDALTSKIGVFKVWGEEYDETQEEHFKGLPAVELEIATGAGEVEVLAEYLGDKTAEHPDGEPVYDCVVRTTKKRGKPCIAAWPAEDFTVARDTVALRDTTYCAGRSRPRAQDLIKDGYDPDLVAELSPYGTPYDTGIKEARDQAGESESAQAPSLSPFNLHQVEIIEHVVRVDADGDGTPELWRVVTGNGEAVLLKRERIDEVPFAVSTPFIVAHRLYGMSLADKIMDIQRYRTVLLRLLFDSGLFAMNQRTEVATGAGRANEYTLSDLMNYVPGGPIRSEDGNSVRAIGGGELAFDVGGALELVATMGEMRSGIVRNAQGLNPDTLHDTAKGALALIGAAQKRVRMIARVFSETGLKDMFLLVHSVTRKLPPSAKKVKLPGAGWVSRDPTTWASRSDMTIEVGVGSGERDQQLGALHLIMDAQKELIGIQGGQANGPFVTEKNVYDTAQKLTRAAGMKSVDPFFTDPAKAKAAAAGQPAAPPPPDADLVKAQSDAELKKYQIDQDMAFKREQLQAEIDLKRHQIDTEARLKAADMITGGGADVRFGGQPG